MVPLALLMAHRLPFIITFTMGTLILAISGTVYALAVDVWMVILARGLQGAAGGIVLPSLHTYIGEMGSMMDNKRAKQGKKPRKFILYIAFSFVLNSGFVVAFCKWLYCSLLSITIYISFSLLGRSGLTSIIAQFDNVNPYRWSGWCVTVLGLAQTIAFFLFFTETRSFTKLYKCSLQCTRFSEFSGFKLSKWTKYLPVSFLFIHAYYMHWLAVQEMAYVNSYIASFV